MIDTLKAVDPNRVRARDGDAAGTAVAGILAGVGMTTGANVDWDALAAVAGAVAAAVAAWQLWRIRVDALDSRAAEIASVALITTVVERPTEGDFRAGRGAWVYEYRVHNPGRLPVSDVRATITFPCEVQRLHHDGTLGTPTRTLELRTHVVAPGKSHGRRRTLLIDENDWASLSDTKAAVTFHTADAGEHTTHWPAPRTKGSSSVRRRLSGPRR